MTNISKAQSKQQTWSSTFRCLGDIFVCNISDFSMNAQTMYPVAWTLNEASTKNDHCPFIDRNIYIFNSKLIFIH